MFIQNIDPVLFKIGFLEIRYYGLVYLLGFLLIIFILNKNKKELNLDFDDIYNLNFYFFIGMIIGARFFHFLFSEPYIFIYDTLEIFKIWNGGMSFFGGFLGVLISGLIYCNKYKKDFYKISDYLVFPATISLILGRLANFANHELVGTVTDLNWCVVFKFYDGCRHPYQLYAAFSHFILLITLFKVRFIKNKYKLKGGIVFISFVFFYSIFRIISDFFREEPRLFGITIWQLISFIFFIISFIWFIKYKRKSIQ